MTSKTKRKLKGAAKSKTMWFNGAVAVAGVAEVLSGNSGIIAALIPGVGPLLAGLGVAGMALRAVTNGSLEDKTY